MTIRKIDKNIGTIPNWGDDDFDANVHENFTDFKEIIPSINNTVDDINLAVNEMNILKNQAETVTSTASNSAAIATQKASEASSSANQALTSKNAIQSYVIPAGASYSVEQINTQNSAMTKAQFIAIEEERKTNRAGSGFDDFCVSNSYYQANGAFTKVNDGLWTRAIPNTLFMDAKYGTYGRNSICVNGVKQHFSLGGNLQNGGGFEIILPTAQTIYPYDAVLTTEQINSGVIKHADSSNSGILINSKFDVDASGWSTTGTNWSWSSGSITLAPTVNADQLKQTIFTINGKKYILEFDVTALSGSIKLMNTALTQLYTISITGRHRVELTADINLTSIIFTRLTAGVSASCTMDNFMMYPADAVSRSDLGFPESFHEDVSEKNFVYPFGNIHYLGGNTDGLTGIANGSFTGFETYSLFGNWQTPSALIGKGYVWSSLTEAQKKAFIANPENNCYLDGDKVIQVRYRIRVVQGWGDDWLTVFNSSLTSSIYSSTGRLASQGKLVIPTALDNGNPAGRYVNSYFQGSILAGNSGLWNEVAQVNGYTGTTVVSIPLALVHRRNQGMYHPVYNANGTKKAVDGNFWYNTTETFTSISDCFNPAKLLTASGYIGSVSGRPDGLFYDQVHEGDITDLRNSSKKSPDKSRLISREFNKLVSGIYRGKEAEWYTSREISNSGTASNVINIEVANATSKVSVGDTVQVFFEHNNSSYRGIVTTVSSTFIIVAGVTYNRVQGSYHTISVKSTRTKSNTLLHCDIIGNPANYPTSWKQNGVFGTPLIVAEDGTSLLPNGALDTFKLSRKVKENTTPLLYLRSTDNGATWTSFTPTFGASANTITLTDEPAGNLVQVFYQTRTIMAMSVVNSEVVEIGKVLGTDGIANGHLISSLIGKVPTANTAPYLQDGYNINAYRIDPATLKFSTTATEIPIHTVLSLAGGASGVPAVKVLPYLTRKNGKGYLNLVFKEMKHNGTSWGDDSKFNIGDNVSNATDQNAQNIIYGTKEVELNLFIGADE